MFVCAHLQTWNRLVLDYQTLYQLLEKVETSLPTVGLMEENEDRLTERINLYQVHHLCFSGLSIKFKEP